MERLKLQKSNSHIVACVKEIPQDPKGIAIVVHGFTSSKENPTVQMLLRRLPEAGIGVVAIDLPAHGQEESKDEELRIEGCKDSLEAAENYAVEHYPDAEIYYFGSSFGAYITGLYISTRPHKGRKAFFRSAAVNMPSLFIKENPTEEERKLLDELGEKGYILSSAPDTILQQGLHGRAEDGAPGGSQACKEEDARCGKHAGSVLDSSLNLGSPVKVTKQMFADLAENDLFEKFDLNRFGKHAVAMAHGEIDTVIDPKAAKKFAEQFDVPITFFEGEGHSLSNDPQTPERVADLAIELYRA